ncbi:MAG: carboxymethylenebutenolidase [Verrucomicrobiales bacterium]|jgi:carboxymethylenebutenolidase
MSSPSGQGYFISPDDGPGPGVLLLHSFWGLNRQTKDTANRLADHGFTALAPDLAGGEVFEDDIAAMEALSEADMNVNAALIQSSLSVLRRAQANPSAPIGIIGFGPGASWALWLSARLVEEIGAVVTYYGSQTMPMDGARAKYLSHWAESDPLVTDLEVADLGLSLQLASLDFRFEHHAGTTGAFAEEGRPGYNAGAEAVAWRQTTEFLAGELRENPPKGG